MATILSLCLAGFFVRTLAIPWSGPLPTLPFGKALINENGWTPKPTAAPKPRLNGSKNYHVSPFGLFERQSEALCGYYYGDISEPFSCLSDNFCSTSGTYVDCVNTANPVLYTTCYESSAWSAHGFPSDVYACTGSSYCYTINLYAATAILTGFGCGTSSGQVVNAYTSPIPTPASFSSSTHGIYTPHPSYTYTPPGPLPHKSKGVSAGAIAGGVVGGLAVLALAVLFIVLRKRKKAKKEPIPYIGVPSAPQEGPGGPQGGAPMSPIPFTENKPFSYNDTAAPQPYYEMSRMQQGTNVQYGGTRHDLQPEPTYYAMGPYYPGKTNSMSATDEIRESTTSPSSALLNDTGFSAPSALSESGGTPIYEAPAEVPETSGRFEGGGRQIYDSSGKGASQSDPRHDTTGW